MANNRNKVIRFPGGEGELSRTEVVKSSPHLTCRGSLSWSSRWSPIHWRDKINLVTRPIDLSPTSPLMKQRVSFCGAWIYHVTISPFFLHERLQEDRRFVSIKVHWNQEQKKTRIKKKYFVWQEDNLTTKQDWCWAPKKFRYTLTIPS